MTSPTSAVAGGMATMAKPWPPHKNDLPPLLRGGQRSAPARLTMMSRARQASVSQPESIAPDA